MFKYLRIAVSVLNLTACVLLVALSVRSYQGQFVARYRIAGTQVVGIGSLPGVMMLAEHNVTVAELRDFQSSRFYFESKAWSLAANEPRWSFGVNEATHSLTYALFPYWFSVMIFAIAAAIPWVRRSQWRFSLRTLLIATTLVAIGLGIALAVS